MKITFSDSFWKSLKTLSMHQTWWYKTYEVFRYKIPVFFKNLWYFKKELWKFRDWDYSFNLSIFASSLEKTAYRFEFHGHESDESRLKKVEKIKRVVQIIKNLNENNYVSIAEKELGEIKNLLGWMNDRPDTDEEYAHNKKVYNRAQELEVLEFDELWDILKGQDEKEFNKIYENLSEKEKINHDHWNKWYDGSGIRNWWD